MEDIKVGNYVRTKQGYIARIIETSPRYIWCDNTIMKNSGIPVYGINIDSEINVIEKHSKNIIDLIEIGDLIKFKNKLSNSLENEEMIIHIFDNDTLEELKAAIINKEIEIISILTKEQFASIEYKLNT